MVLKACQCGYIHHEKQSMESNAEFAVDRGMGCLALLYKLLTFLQV